MIRSVAAGLFAVVASTGQAVPFVQTSCIRTATSDQYTAGPKANPSISGALFRPHKPSFWIESIRQAHRKDAGSGWDTTPPPAKRGDVFDVRCGPDGCTYATILDFDRYESEWIVSTAQHTPGRSAPATPQRQQFEVTCGSRSPAVIGEDGTPTAGSVSINLSAKRPPTAERFYYNLWYAFCRREAVKFKD